MIRKEQNYRYYTKGCLPVTPDRDPLLQTANSVVLSLTANVPEMTWSATLEKSGGDMHLTFDAGDPTLAGRRN
jgi:hypothetical protein